MKQDTFVLVIVAGCYLIMGLVSPLVSGLGQWTETGEWPPPINWVVIGAMCLSSAATQLIAFFSQRYGNWRAERMNDGNGKGQPEPGSKP